MALPDYMSYTAAKSSGRVVTLTRPPTAQTGTLLIVMFTCTRFFDAWDGLTKSVSWNTVSQAPGNYSSAWFHGYRHIADINTEPADYTFTVDDGSPSWYSTAIIVAVNPIGAPQQPYFTQTYDTANVASRSHTPTVQSGVSNLILVLAAEQSTNNDAGYPNFSGGGIETVDVQENGVAVTMHSIGFDVISGAQETYTVTKTGASFLNTAAYSIAVTGPDMVFSDGAPSITGYVWSYGPSH